MFRGFFPDPNDDRKEFPNLPSFIVVNLILAGGDDDAAPPRMIRMILPGNGLQNRLGPGLLGLGMPGPGADLAAAFMGLGGMPGPDNDLAAALLASLNQPAALTEEKRVEIVDRNLIPYFKQEIE